jgi:hypothetical protein
MMTSELRTELFVDLLAQRVRAADNGDDAAADDLRDLAELAFADHIADAHETLNGILREHARVVRRTLRALRAELEADRIEHQIMEFRGNATRQIATIDERLERLDGAFPSIRG